MQKFKELFYNSNDLLQILFLLPFCLSGALHSSDQQLQLFESARAGSGLRANFPTNKTHTKRSTQSLHPFAYRVSATQKVPTERY